MSKEAKSAIFLLVVIVYFLVKYLLGWLSIKMHFEQNNADIQFEKNLYESLAPYKIIKVSDIHKGNWNKVCILYVYGKPEEGTKQYANQLEENFYLGGKWESPFLPEKSREGVWWVFYVDKDAKVSELYRMGRSVGPTFHEFSIYEKEVPEFLKHIDLNEYRLLMPSDPCATADNAYFMQTHEGYLYNKGKAFIFMARKQ